MHTVEGCIGPVNSQGHTVKGDDYSRLSSPGCLTSQSAKGSLEEAGVVKDSRNGVGGFQSSRVWRHVTGLVQVEGAGRRPWWWQWPKHCVSSPSQCDMQKLTVDELKRLLYDTFCEHLSMKDIENIIMTEEESHLGTAEECPVDVESE